MDKFGYSHISENILKNICLKTILRYFTKIQEEVLQIRKSEKVRIKNHKTNCNNLSENIVSYRCIIFRCYVGGL